MSCSPTVEVDELLVAEVLDHVGAAAERAGRALGVDVEVLGPDAHRELVPGEALDGALVALGQRDVDAIAHEPDVAAIAMHVDIEEVHGRASR